MQRPVPRPLGAALKRNHPRRRAGPQRYLETVQPDGQAAAHGLDVRLFPSPTVEKTGLLLLLGKREQFGGLRGREEPVRDVAQIAYLAVLFHVHSDVAARGENIRGQMAGIGHVESQGA